MYLSQKLSEGEMLTSGKGAMDVVPITDFRR
jgi:hypothetical protein